VAEPLLIWWSALCAAAAANLVLWGASARRLRREAARMAPEALARRRALLWLSAAYVLGCGFRSAFPMIDVPRSCLHDPWFARVFVGRSVATVAELAFAAQWALLLGEAAASSRAAALAARAIVPLIAAAEAFSWSAVLSGDYLLHAAENSLWTVAAALGVAAFAALQPGSGRRARAFLAAAMLCGAAYVTFMVLVDLPMYLHRWQAQAAGDDGFRDLAEGLRSLLAPCVVRLDWASWREDVPWLTLYFTFAVWISIALAHAPPLGGGGGAFARPRPDGL